MNSFNLTDVRFDFLGQSLIIKPVATLCPQTTCCFSGFHPYVTIFHSHQHELEPFQMLPAQKRPVLVKLAGTRWHRQGCPALQISKAGAASASCLLEMRKEDPAPQHTMNTPHAFLE